MAYVPKDGSGSLFRNDKNGNDKRPDWRGDLMIGEQMYELAAWEKQGARGTFFSLSAKPKQAEGPREQRSPREQKPAARDYDDDDIPF